MARERVATERVSDLERRRAVDVLGAHMVSGAITSEELARRSELVLEARTRGELAAALQDLPALPRRPLLVRAAELVPLRTHVIAYVVVSAAVVVFWAVTRERDPGATEEGFGVLWPFWIMLLWGALLVVQALYVLRQPLIRRARRRGVPRG